MTPRLCALACFLKVLFEAREVAEVEAVVRGETPSLSCEEIGMLRRWLRQWETVG
jgi:hypothetical protein